MLNEWRLLDNIRLTNFASILLPSRNVRPSDSSRQAVHFKAISSSYAVSLTEPTDPPVGLSNQTRLDTELTPNDIFGGVYVGQTKWLSHIKAWKNYCFGRTAFTRTSVVLFCLDTAINIIIKGNFTKITKTKNKKWIFAIHTVHFLSHT